MQEWNPPICIGVHAVFAKKCLSGNKKFGAMYITCNTIPHYAIELILIYWFSKSTTKNS
jgi:hypothetical protein